MRRITSGTGVPPAMHFEASGTGVPPVMHFEASGTGVPPAMHFEVSGTGVPPAMHSEVSGTGVPPAMHFEASGTGVPPVRRCRPRGHAPLWSAPVLEVASIFGLDLDHLHDAARVFDRAALDRADALVSLLAPGVIVLLTGPSGSGKSTLLRAIVERLSHRGRAVIDAGDVEIDESECVIEAIDGSTEERCALLARVGLAEARLLVSPVRRLSEGQRARLRAALAFDAARRLGGSASSVSPGDGAAVIVIDEFLSPLDRITACCVARSVSRLTRASTCSLLVATAHDDLATALKPDHNVRLTLS